MASNGRRNGIDVAGVRADTPGCREVAHFNNAGASLMPRPVLDTVIGHLELESRIGGYEAADEARDRLEAVYDSAARLINCRPSEIALFENATHAFNAVLYALPFSPGDRILTGKAEYASNYMAYLHLARTAGVEVVVVPDDRYGQIDVAELARRIHGRTRLIALTHVPTSGGLVNPVADVGRVARGAGVPFLLDACQSVGQMPIDVEAIGCHFLSTTGRKFLRGPRGTGFLYVGTSGSSGCTRRSSTWAGRSGPGSTPTSFARTRFETWEASHALRLGFGRAIDYALDLGLDAIWARIGELAEVLRTQLARIAGVTQHDRGADRCGIISFSVANVPPDDVKVALAAARINVEISYVEDTRLDLEERGLDRFVRASVHY